MVTRVALINPPSPFLLSDTIMPPLGIMYLSSYLKSKGVDAKIFDLASNPTCENEVGTTFPDFNSYDIYAFTATTPQYPTVLQILNCIKPILNPESIFVIGGAHSTAFQEKCRPQFDYVIYGEGEEALYTISKLYKPNIIKGKQINIVDTIPFPDRNFKGFEKYHYEIDGNRATTMITSRGCHFRCAFCMNIWGNRVRLRSSENVIDEVKEVKRLGFDAIQFYDDTFTVSRKRLYKICDGLRKLEMKWRCFIHANTVNKEDLKYMKMSGCVEVGMGVESGNNLILKTINKKIDINRAIQICNLAHEVGLRIKTFLIIGLPGESYETVNSTIRFLELAKPDDFDYSIYTPFPNTKIWNEKENFDIIFDKEKLEFSKMFYKGKVGQYCSQVSTSNLKSTDIEALRDYVDTVVRWSVIR